MKTYILIGDIDNCDRKDLEYCEGMSFQNITELNNFLILEKYDFNYWSLGDFVDMCNNEDFNSDNYWISFVTIND